jgi:hypothetical protein
MRLKVQRARPRIFISIIISQEMSLLQRVDLSTVLCFADSEDYCEAFSKDE